MTRKQIIRAGYRQMCKSSDLHHVGYTVSHWLRVRDGACLDEYLPRMADSKLPRLVAKTYEEQCEIHGQLGLPIVGPGQQWNRNGQQYLFSA